MQSLAVKYRPKSWAEVCDQTAVVKILQQQIATETFSNAYIFSGASGAGKTTAGRLLAQQINNNQGSPIEIDAASNNGVENIKRLVKSAQERSVDSKYKVIILDEAHALTSQSWQALLKCIEEPPQYTIFILCTTDPQKIPETIQNRCQRFNFTKISLESIVNRLRYICIQENFSNYESSLHYIAKLSNGCMRDAISLLEKCAAYSTNMPIETTPQLLQSFSYTDLFELTYQIMDLSEVGIIEMIDNYYFRGLDIKLLINNYLSFLLDIIKYMLLKSFDTLSIPITYKKELDSITNSPENIKFFRLLLNEILKLKEELKNDLDPKITVQVKLLQIARMPWA